MNIGKIVWSPRKRIKLAFKDGRIEPPTHGPPDSEEQDDVFCEELEQIIPLGEKLLDDLEGLEFDEEVLKSEIVVPPESSELVLSAEDFASLDELPSLAPPLDSGLHQKSSDLIATLQVVRTPLYGSIPDGIGIECRCACRFDKTREKPDLGHAPNRNSIRCSCPSIGPLFVTLTGKWKEWLLSQPPPLVEGDFLNIFVPNGSWEAQHLVIDESSLIIAHPQIMLTATVVSGTFGCIRKSALQYLITPFEDGHGNAMPALIGHVMHGLLQSVAISKDAPVDPNTLSNLASNLSREHLVALWQSNRRTPTDLCLAVAPRISGLSRYLASNPLRATAAEVDMENPVFGLKGKVDLVSDDSKSGSLEIIEIKTGKPHGSHLGQALIYSLLARPRKSSPRLLYVDENGNVSERFVNAGSLETVDLVCARNNLAGYIVRNQLPEILKNSVCRTCPWKSICDTAGRIEDELDGRIRSSYLSRWWSVIASEEQAADIEDEPGNSFSSQAAFRRMRGALVAVAESSWLSTLDATRSAQIGIEVLSTQEKSITKTLTAEQREAVGAGLFLARSGSNGDCIRVKGFPGAGKSTLLATLARALLNRGHRVLLSAHTHSAIDNVLEKVLSADPEIADKILRIGRGQDVSLDSSKLLPPSCLSGNPCALNGCVACNDIKSYLSSKRLIACTALGMHAPLIAGEKFRVLLMDEAGQVADPALWNALLKSEVAILSGDEKQLGPLSRSKRFDSMQQWSESFFSRSVSGFIELTEQFRMNAEIAAVANRLFYGGRLRCGSLAVSTRRLPVWQSQTDDRLNSIWSPEHPVILIKSGDLWSTTLDLLQNTPSAFSIGVLCPLRKQVAEISDKFPALDCLTFDRAQGRDWDAVIVCLFGSESLLQENKRLVVALTRAKAKMIIIGGTDSVWSACPGALEFS